MAEIDMRFSPRVMLGSSVRLGPEAAAWGNRALIVADAAVADAAEGLQDQLDSLGISAILFMRQGLPAASEALDEALSLARGSRAGMVVSAGGTEVMSLGRLVAAMVPKRIHAADVLGTPRISGEGLPIVEVPASGRHALMFRHEAFLSDSEHGRTVLASYPAPPSHAVIVDSALAGRMSPGASVMCAASRLASALEAFLSPRSSFLSDIQARSAVDSAADLARRVREEADHPDFRVRETESTVTAALAAGFTGIGPGLALARAAATAAGIPGATSHAVLLPWILESPIYAGSPRAAEAARMIAGFDADSSGEPAGEIRSLFGRLGIPGRLREAGADLVDILPAAGWAAAMADTDRADFDEATFRDILELAC